MSQPCSVITTRSSVPYRSVQKSYGRSHLARRGEECSSHAGQIEAGQDPAQGDVDVVPVGDRDQHAGGGGVVVARRRCCRSRARSRRSGTSRVGATGSAA